MRSRIPIIAASLALTVGASAGVAVLAVPAQAATICDQYGTEVVGSYIVQNNRWGTDATQCIETTGTGFRITQQDGTASTSGAPVSYPSIFLGCHYSTCSPGFTPVRLGDLTSAQSSISFSYVSGATYDAAYDIWLNADSDVSVVQDTEIMIWFDRRGSIQPIGSQIGTTTLAGQNWEVWQGSNGSNDVISYVAPTTLNGLTFDANVFIRHAMDRGLATEAWYLTSIQAGFEPWTGGAGLAVTDFSVALATGSASPEPTDQPTITLAPTTTTIPPTDTPTESPTETPKETPKQTPPPTDTPTSKVTPSPTPAPTATDTPTHAPVADDCSATVVVINDWDVAYQGELVVTAGASGVDGWTVKLALNGATYMHTWTGAFSGNTVTNLDWNGKLSAGQTATAGFTAQGGVPTVISCTS